MSLPRWTSAALLVFVVSGCGTTGTTLKCQDATCPVVLEAGLFGSYRATPETVYAVPPRPRVIVWRFAAGGGSFSMTSAPPDGIEVDGVPDPFTIGIFDCRPSADDKGISEVRVGPFYRCKVRGQAVDFTKSYQLRFHDANGKQRMLDPYVTNSGGPADGVAPPPVSVLTKGITGPIVRISLTNSNNPDPAVVVAPGPNDEATVVVWTAPAGSVFNTDPFRSAPDGVTFDNATGTSRPPCRAASDADGAEEVDSGPYYRCTIWKGVAILPTAYSVQFRSGSTVRTLRGQLNQ